MVIFLNVADAAAARTFIESEPYTANGVFDRVEVRAWMQVLPDATPGAFNAVLAKEPAQ